MLKWNIRSYDWMQYHEHYEFIIIMVEPNPGFVIRQQCNSGVRWFKALSYNSFVSKVGLDLSCLATSIFWESSNQN